MKYCLISLAAMCLAFNVQAKPINTMLGHLDALSNPASGIGPRPPASDAEKKAADYIETQWQAQGYTVVNSPFTYTLRDKTYSSQNVSITLPGKSDDMLYIAAHYDSIGNDSHGVIDNAASVALLLTLSETLASQSLPISITMLAFGAEEVSMQGSKAYVKTLSQEQLNKAVGMINLDTVVGGDILYIHSAHSTPYDCAKETGTYSHSPSLRDELLAYSNTFFKQQTYTLHPEYKGYPEGETGYWSDHSPFACLGIPIAYLEATNFTINGKEGFDGYSQTTHNAMWDCFDDKQNTACDRDAEKQWGNIWHTSNDNTDVLKTAFPKRIGTQLNIHYQLLLNYLMASSNNQSE
ncbi:M28 family metallopeptidase [Alteromonas facilis]|uniref:M28 family metallopeptidase n=1 Tax=Alteromonas facilis TaxID=2048004 RepID=UPI000C282A46|nr:M28 family peptidase [Alteromonas facilis]